MVVHMCYISYINVSIYINLQVSFAKEPYKRDYTLQKRLIILRSLLIEATPYHIRCIYVLHIIYECEHIYISYILYLYVAYVHTLAYMLYLCAAYIPTLIFEMQHIGAYAAYCIWSVIES